MNALKNRLKLEWVLGTIRADQWAGSIVAFLKPKSLLDVGCGDGSKLGLYLDFKPELFCGVEANPVYKVEAEKRGIQISSIDLNGAWPYADTTFDVVHSAFLIEHLHHTRLFLMEAFRVLKPGGTAVITTENLCSLLNWGAMTLGYTPFSMMHCCGWMTGNPFGLHYQEKWSDHLPIQDPAFPGVNGHVRVLAVDQARELCEKVGFKAEVTSICILPLTNWMSRPLERLFYRRGHFLLIKAVKPK
jgi:SAM-dependent methyltransferase